MMTKAALSRADLLWGFAAVDQDQQEAVAELLGFEKAYTKTAIESQSTLSISATLPKLEGNFQFSSELKRPLSAEISPPTYYRITERKHETEPDERTDLRPEWLQKAEANYFSKATLSIPAIHRTTPEYQPLVAWARLWPFLYRVLGSENNGSKADVDKLVQQVAAGKLIRKVPRLPHQSWSEFATILIDINDKNFPYRNDFFYLCTQLKKLRGQQGLDIQYLNAAPGGYVLRYQQQQETISRWQVPDADTPLLILSDLGMHAKSRAALYDWLVFGQQLQLHGCRPVVLMPVAARDLDARLLQYFDCVVWDSTSQLKSIVTTRLAEPTE